MRLFYFTKDNCAPCKFTRPLILELERTGVSVQYIDCSPGRDSDVDELLQIHGIRSVPAVLVFDDNGAIKANLFGAGINTAALEAALANA